MKFLILILTGLGLSGCATIDDAYAKHFGTTRTYETIGSQTYAAEQTCGKGRFTLYNTPVAMDKDGNQAWFICR